MKVVYPDASAVMRSLLDPAQLRLLPGFVVYEGSPANEGELIARLRGASAVVLGWAYIGERVLAACPHVQLISFTGSGVGSFVDLEAATRRGVTVSNTPHYGDDTVAEHTLGLLLALARRIPALHQDLRRGRWQPGAPGRELHGKTLGILGLGAIGSRVARWGMALGMRVVAWTAHPSPERAEAHRVSFVSLEELAAASDVVSVHLPLTPTTRRLIDSEFLSWMRPDAMLLNTSRGEIVDTAALLEALRSGRLAGAALDVFEEEPLPGEHPLLGLDNVVLTPHVGFYTREATARMLRMALDNVLAFLQGRPQHVVNQEVLGPGQRTGSLRQEVEP